jgi:uncharacterized membrane protein YfbV (UPF0208 family)
MFSLRLLLFLSFCLYVHVASAETEEDGRLWFNVNAVGKLPAQSWQWYAELQPRWREEGSHMDQLLIRPAVFYQINR